MYDKNDLLAVHLPGVVLQSQFPPSFFPHFQNYQNIAYLLNMTFIFDNFHSLAAATPVKCEYDQTDWRVTVAK